MPICDGNAVPGKRSVLARVTFARWLCRSPAAAMLAMGLLASSPLSAQTITIDSVPPYGAPGSISGTVTGVNFAQHRVAVYIHIEGVGWWTKPGAANPTVPIQPNGAFTANVYTCCLDDRATIFYAALIPSAVTPPLASASLPPSQPPSPRTSPSRTSPAPTASRPLASTSTRILVAFRSSPARAPRRSAGT